MVSTNTVHKNGIVQKAKVVCLFSMKFYDDHR